MTRRMSCSMSVDQVRDRSKTVTRRHVDTWKTLRAGDRLTLIEKGMGLAKGEHQVVLADVEIIDVRVEVLDLVDDRECVLEGFEDMAPEDFVAMWCASHGYPKALSYDGMLLDHARWTECRRIEWVYL